MGIIFYGLISFGAASFFYGYESAAIR